MDLPNLNVILNIKAYSGKDRKACVSEYKAFCDLIFSRIADYPRDESLTDEKRKYREQVLQDIHRTMRKFSLRKVKGSRLKYIARNKGAMDTHIVTLFKRLYDRHMEMSPATGALVIRRSSTNKNLFSGHIIFPEQDEMVITLELEFEKLLSHPVGHPLGIQVTNDLPNKNPIKNSFKRPQASRDLFGKDYYKTNIGTIHRFTPYGPVGSGEDTVGTDPRQIRLRRMSQRLERLCHQITQAFRVMKQKDPTGFRRIFGDNLETPEYNTVEFKTYVSSRVKRSVLVNESNASSDGTRKHSDRQNGAQQQYSHANTQMKNSGVVTFSLGGPRQLVFSRKGQSKVTFTNEHGTSFFLDPRDEEHASKWGHEVPPITNACGVSVAAVFRPNYATVQVHESSSLQVECPRIVEKLKEPYRDTNGFCASRRQHYDQAEESLQQFKETYGSAIAAELRKEFGKYFSRRKY